MPLSGTATSIPEINQAPVWAGWWQPACVTAQCAASAFLRQDCCLMPHGLGLEMYCACSCVGLWHCFLSTSENVSVASSPPASLKNRPVSKRLSLLWKTVPSRASQLIKIYDQNLIMANYSVNTPHVNKALTYL